MENLIKKANQDLEATLAKLPFKRTKCDFEAIQLYNHYDKLSVRELYQSEYLNLETNKRIQNELR